jgi:hypothetical protein
LHPSTTGPRLPGRVLRSLIQDPAIGLPRIEQLETGHYPTGSRLSTIRRLAEALGVDPRELLED